MPLASGIPTRPRPVTDNFTELEIEKLTKDGSNYSEENQ